MRAILKPPVENYYGNLLWDIYEAKAYSSQIKTSLEKVRELGYYASPFPEGDGVAFGDEKKNKTDEKIITEVCSCFDWLEISVDTSFKKEAKHKNTPLPSLGFEKNVIIKKSDIALMQIEDAIDLFIQGRRVSAITLAGAADGILSGLIKEQGGLSPAEESWSHIEEVREKTGLPFAGDRTKKDAFNEWNMTRNRLKHHDKRDDEAFEVNVFDHAYYEIKRAIAGAEKLGLKIKNGYLFENFVIENVCM